MMPRAAKIPGALQGLALVACVCWFGCLEASQEPVSFPLYLAGSEIEGAFGGRDEWQIELERAHLAFGPLYLCPGHRAGASCDTARAEYLDSALIDLLDPEPSRAGTMVGVSGAVRSWMYDLGLPSLLTADVPLVLEAARMLDGHSMVMVGRAFRPGLEVPFVAEIALQREPDTEQGLPLVRKGGSDVFFHEITGSEDALSMHFDPRPWLAQVDFDAFTEVATCGESDRTLVCSGSVERHCAADGSVESERDCAERDEICVPDHGCMSHARFEVGGQAWRAVRNALTSGARPQFVWRTNP
jgi:hypothetical protein